MREQLDPAASPQTTEESYDRRRGPRRSDNEAETAEERRSAQRRTRMPGLGGLLDAIVNAEVPMPSESTVLTDRRRGPRRESNAQAEVPAERRQTDRRKRKPGLPALFGAVLAPGDEKDAE